LLVEVSLPLNYSKVAQIATLIIEGGLMVRLITFFLKHPVRVILVFVFAAVISGVCSLGVTTNYDFSDYLPENAQSTVGLKVFKAEFGENLPNTRILYQDVSLQEAVVMKKSLEQIPGVLDVVWLDDIYDITTPLEIENQSVIRGYYRDHNALYTVTISKDTQLETLKDIRALLGDRGAVSGSLVETADAMSSSAGEVPKIMMFAVPLVLLILLLTTSSWIEPILFLITIGIAILLNMGTNLAFGEISFVTATSAAILQFAVSMDYSIVLLHRFGEYRHEGLETNPAMVLAVKKAFATVSSSALTTVVGFWVLVFMKFKIGPDMGWVLAKGILFSLISVMILLPALILVCDKWIEKTKHRPVVRDVNKMARTMAKVQWVLLILVVLLAVPAFLAHGKADFTFGASKFFSAETQVGKDKALIEERFGKSNEMVLLVPKNDMASLSAFTKDLEGMKYVSSVVSYANAVGTDIPVSLLTPAQSEQFFSKNYSRVVVISNLDVEGSAVFKLIDKIRGAAESYYGTSYNLIGESVSTYDMKVIISKDNELVTWLAILGIGLIILLTFRNLLLPVIMVLVIESAIWINLSVPYFMDTKLVYIAFLILSSIQLGATVDYAILYSARFMDFRTSLDKREAIIHATQATMTPILTSALILGIAGFCLGFVSTNYAISQIGILIGRGALLSAGVVLFVLPALLHIFDRPVQKLNFKSRKEEVI
jgi:hypothetical protein